MFSLHMLNGLFDPIINWASGLFYYISVGVYYIVICGIGKIVDIIQLLFRKFAGLDGLSLGGAEEGDIVMQFINSSIVQNVFISMIVLAVVLIFITSFVAVLKTEFNKDGNNSKRKVFKNAIRGVVNFLVVPLVCFFGLLVGNALLQTIDGALTNNSQSLSMTSQIFVAGGYNSNRVRKYEGTGDNATCYKKGTMASYVTGGEKNGIGYGSFGIFYDDATGVVQLTAADKIDNAFANNITVDLNNLSLEEKTLVYADGDVSEYFYSYANNFSLGAFPWGHTSFNWTGDNGIKGVTLGDEQGLINEGTQVTFSIYNVGLVSYYYDLSLFTFDYLVCGIALAFAAWVYVTTLLGLIKRLFMLVTLFIISPPVCALYPLDEGKALGKWREEFIRQALSAYSVVIILNVFFLLLPLMLQIQIIPVGSDILLAGGVSGGGISSGLVNYIARVLIVIGALVFFKDASKSLSGIIGAGSAFIDGSDGKKDFNKRVNQVKTVPGQIGKFTRGVADFFSYSRNNKNQMNNEDIDKTAQSDALSGGDVSSKSSSNSSTTSGDKHSLNKSGKLAKGLGVAGAGLGVAAAAFVAPGLAVAAGIGVAGYAIKKGIVKSAEKGNKFSRAITGTAKDLKTAFGKNYKPGSIAEAREKRNTQYEAQDLKTRNETISRLNEVTSKHEKGLNAVNDNEELAKLLEEEMKQKSEEERQEYETEIQKLLKENEEIQGKLNETSRDYEKAKKQLNKLNKKPKK